MASKSKTRRISLADADRAYTAAKDQVEGALRDTLDRLGLDERVAALRTKIDEMDVRESIDKAQEYLSDQIDSARDYARENPGKVIGGAAGVLVGASLLAYALSRAGKKTPVQRLRAKIAKKGTSIRKSIAKKRSR